MKLKLPLLINSAGTKYVLTRGFPGRITMVDIATGNVYTNHTTDETALMFLNCNTWVAIINGIEMQRDNLVNAVHAAKEELRVAELALKNHQAAYLEE